jgi:exportin-5
LTAAQTFYDILEQKVKEISAKADTDEKPQIELSSLLLIVMCVFCRDSLP